MDGTRHHPGQGRTVRSIDAHRRRACLPLDPAAAWRAPESRELFTLAAIALALGVAYGCARLFDVSVALGAFFAGMVITGSDLSHKAAAYLQPLQDVFAALFFVAVGMLFEPAVLWTAPAAGTHRASAIIVIGKSLAALASCACSAAP